jgi:hypothetical protein
MQHLLRNKIIIVLLLVCSSTISAVAQFNNNLNLPDHDSKKFHFGILLGSNRAYYQFSHNKSFLAQDSVLGIESLQSTGINMGWLVNMRLSDYFDLRTYPINLIFTEKAFEYRFKYPDPFVKEDSLTIRKVQGITLALPLQLKFCSDRINNLKVYMLAGGKVEYDFAANAGEKNTDRQIKLSNFDYGIEAGIGFHFYFPVFVLSPELKAGWGFRNVHSRNETSKYSNVIDQVKSRTISFSLIIE